MKHFRMSNGNITAAVYPFDVHYEDDEGIMQDINNSLVSEKDGSDDVFSNKKNSTYVKFMKKSNSNKLYTINKSDYKFKVSIEGASKVSAVVENTEYENKQDNPYVLKNLGSQVTYEDILENTDIQYKLVAQQLKENIIIKKEVDFNSIVYNYHLNGGLDAVQKDTKNIIVYEKDSDKVVLNISAPVMWDSAGAYYENLRLELLEEKNSKMKIKLSWDIQEDAVYPVTIDPVMSFSTNRNNIQDTHIIAGYPTTNYDYNNHIRVRNDGYSLLKFPTPTLNSGDKIINAQLVLAPYGAFDNSLSIYSNANSYNPPLYITTHKILRSWEETTATYQNVDPNNGFYDSTAYSYRIVDGDISYYTWDITRLANEWTECGVANYGVLLKYAANPSDGSVFDSFFCSTNGAFIDSSAWPQILFQYINTTGIEDYYSYHTQDIGYAGTGYVNDLTGNLTIINPVVQTGGSLMPITVSLVYNMTSLQDGEAPYGRGWKLNWSQKIEWSVKSNYDNTQYVKYTDGDGTEHYFTINSSTGVWTDEIKPDRKVYYLESLDDYKMTDSSGACMYFTRNGTLNEWYLYKVEDAYGNYMEISLNSSNIKRIDQIYTSTGNVVDFIYNQYDFLVGIQYNDETQTKTITIGYNNHVTTPNNCISNVYYPDGTYVQYHYYDTTSYISKVVDVDGQHIVYNYKWTTPLRVVYVAEQGSDSVLGAVMSMSYETTATIFHDVTNNRKYLYTFASNGTLKSIVDITANDGNGYGQYYEYNKGNTNKTNGMGNLTFVSKTQKSSVNILQNHSFETEGYHYFTAWDETTGVSSGTYTTEKSHMGARSYKITRPSDSNASRALGYYYMYLQGNRTYTLSAYVNTVDMTSQGKGASLYFVGNGLYAESEYIAETKDEWQRISVSFTTTTSEYVSICMSLSGATGSVYFDNIQLEEGELSDYNLLENAGFEDDNSSYPRGWNPSTYVGSVTETQKVSGNRSIHISGSITKHLHYMQEITMPNGKKDDTYVASAFAKANSVPADGWKFTILIRFLKNGSTVNEQSILFNSYTTEWQKISGVARAAGDYDSVTFWLLYYSNCNSVYFDNAQLIRDTFGSAYTYDENGNLISTVDLQGKEEYTFKYDGNNQLIKQNNVSGSKILYTYNLAKPQQLDIVSSGGATTCYTYDGFGNAITSTTTGGELVPDRYYYIQNLQYNKYLDTHNFGISDGTTIKYEVLGKNSAQKWKLIQNSDHTYSLSPECAPNSVLSVEPSTLYNTAKVALYSQGAVSHQKFNITKFYGNVYRLDVASTGYSLDGVETGCYVYESHAQEYQQFAFIPAEGNEAEAIVANASYSSNGEYLVSLTDSRGNNTSYEYNDKRGYLTSATNAKDIRTDYTYNESEQLKKVSIDNAVVTYDYDTAKRLSSITSPSGTAYDFAYDNFGNNTAVKIGSRSLSSRVYDNAKGLLDYTLYGNGTLIDCSYDTLGRQTETIINQTLRYKKFYDGVSRLHQVDDLELGKKIKYEYDILNRAVSEKLINTATNKVYAQLDICYDDTKNRMAGYDVEIEGVSKATDFVYGENFTAPDIITSIKHNGMNRLSYSYDGLNRLSAKTLATSTPYTSNYTYLPGGGYIPIDFSAENTFDQTVTGDFNGDGRDDIASVYEAGNYIIEIKVWLATDDGFTEIQTWNRTTQYGSENIIGRVVAGDFNGDGKDDVATIYNYGNYSGQIHVFLSTGSEFSFWHNWWTLTQYDVNKITDRVVAGDFNGDGKDDIAAVYDYGNYETGIHSFLSSGNGFTNIGYPQDITAYNANSVTGRVVSGDFNKDGKDDIVTIYDYDWKMQMHLFAAQNGEFPFWNAFSPMITQYNPILTSRRVTAGDYNNDGNLDIAAIYDYNGLGQIHFYPSNGTEIYGWLGCPDALSTGYPIAKIYGMLSGNYNGDSYSDISILLKTGNTSAQLHTLKGSADGIQKYEVWWNSLRNTVTNSNTTTTLVKTIKNGNDTLEYTYDEIGNITSIAKNGTEIEQYTYDALNQLTTVTRGTDIYKYTYDHGGNILSVKKNDTIIKNYTYGDSEWKDLLTAYNGETFTYDAIGNPLTYRGGMSLTWKDGRKLSEIAIGTDSISYAYDANGLRNSKTVNGTTTEYYWLNGTLQAQKTGSEYMMFLHGENGTAYGFLLKNDTGEQYYYYLFNVQGDVIGILDSEGTQVVEYTYNEWGELLNISGTMADTIGQKNPLRYRGYYYDAETGFYYVSSRYYDPEIGRFVSADTTDILGVSGDLYDKNLYAYCDNNPVIRKDVDGELWIVAVCVGLATQYVGDVVANIADGATGTDIFSFRSTAGEYIAAGVTALIPGSGLTGSLIRNVATEAIVSVERSIKGQSNSLVKSATRVALGTVIDTGVEKVTNSATKYISSKTSKTYSQYAKTVRKKNPTASTNTIRQSAQRSVRWGTRLSNCINFITNALRSALKW